MIYRFSTIDVGRYRLAVLLGIQNIKDEEYLHM